MEKILAVDDEIEMLDVCKRVLERKKYHVRTAANGKEALELLRHDVFDLALVDLRMPAMDGMELLRKIKEYYPHTEVVILTAEATTETALEALQIGAFDYVLKPFNITELLTSVQRAIGHAQLRRQEFIFRETTYLYQCTHETKGGLKQENLLKIILERATEALHADAGSLFIFHPKEGTLKLMTCKGLSLNEEVELKLGEQVAGWVAEHREPVLIRDMLKDVPQFKAMTSRDDIASSMVMPLLKNDTLYGVLCLNRYTNMTNYKFTQHDMESLQIFVTHATLIMDLHQRNASLK